MQEPREMTLTGLEAVEAATGVLQRIRNAHPTDGLYDAAEVQWWWGVERPTDTVPQLFWLDEDGVPMASVFAADFGVASSALYTDTTVVISVMPDATPEWITHVTERGLAHVGELGIDAASVEVDQADAMMIELLTSHGFARKEDALVLCSMDAADRSEVSSLADGYRLAPRSEMLHRTHHMVDDRRPRIEERLQETSLYRADLDLAVFDADDNPAGYGLFWFDPVSNTGVVEPMRTHDDHQQRGLARHILTSGLSLLAEAGAQRIGIGYEPDNPASGHLYRSVGFVPDRQTDVYSRG